MLNVKAFVVEWKEKIKERIAKLMRKPVLVIVQMGNVEASNRYVRNKVKDANEVGIDAVVAHFEEDDFEHGKEKLEHAEDENEHEEKNDFENAVFAFANALNEISILSVD